MNKMQLYGLVKVVSFGYLGAFHMLMMFGDGLGSVRNWVAVFALIFVACITEKPRSVYRAETKSQSRR